ncbi:MAG TPA: SMC-Scp complex subunit ScpB, partial [Rhodocyclaceae bacterium]|nr:SMC-Scp complex subunit ScpB [Rhodocyclaceae bacterium]
MSDSPNTPTLEDEEGLLPSSPSSSENNSSDGKALEADGDVVLSDDLAGIDVHQAKRVLEAALLSATEPLPAVELRRMFQPDLGAELMNRLLVDLQQDWQDQAVQLLRLASGWRFQTRPDLQVYLERLRDTRPPRYSRAVLETLAIIVYR